MQLNNVKCPVYTKQPSESTYSVIENRVSVHGTTDTCHVPL